VACELRPTRYDLVMQGFGGEGENITELGQVAPAVLRAFASGKPYLLNVNIRGARSPFTDWQIGGKKQ
jgi:acetolactate synthase-1/2/3 large subunit